MYNVMQTFRERLKELQAHVADVARQVGREDVPTILAVTKGIPLERILEARDAGLKLFGENRVQEAREKIPHLPDVEWHLIGHLQRNKVKLAVRLFHMIQSVDRPALVEALTRHLTRPMPVLVEVNTSGEPQKHGVSTEEDLFRLTETILNTPMLQLRGLMTMGPYPVEEKKSRQAFATLRRLRDRLQEKLGVPLPILSMGMSEDWRFAVMEGSTMLRLGRALFGERRA